MSGISSKQQILRNNLNTSSRPKGEEVLGKTTDNIKKAITVKIGKNRFPDQMSLPVDLSTDTNSVANLRLSGVTQLSVVLTKVLMAQMYV